ncbi:fiber (DUF1218) [Rhynchospora pubera]|uniref:Fiber (DUF1218) n=1 Tax=Rhynchospora pubera TaxID=906938 RepID=A0AAV8EK98_9POAL|nr:fiber (DUF1218) [Rhynchospora pubera]KAJ4778592.1 fiber (DUF1218) [Rhynchospora pubera]KAJ4785461.1 fiber (DUF1218) [Rhynchospora pubera]KAJ4805702.1 fiber (DUF1218) [Rhynchospora pubera]KAJ4805813.1 fiber (DUF1218) [Rhynchospora pubera]
MVSGKIIVLVLVFVLDVIAFGLAVAAEQRRSTATLSSDSEKNYTFCVYDSDISTGYGFGAFFLLLFSQIILMVGSRCFCCGPAMKPGGSRACALILFLFCWLTFIIAEACLFAGSLRNAYHTKYRTLFVNDPPTCEMVRKGVFAAGAAFVFFTAILSEFYYISFSKARDASGGASYGGASIGMSNYS